MTTDQETPEETEVPVGAPEAPQELPKEPKQRETVRGLLALSLVGVFALEVVGGFIYLFWTCGNPQDTINALKELATIFLGPTVALVGAATGFYFGRSPS